MMFQTSTTVNAVTALSSLEKHATAAVQDVVPLIHAATPKHANSVKAPNAIPSAMGAALKNAASQTAAESAEKAQPTAIPKSAATEAQGNVPSTYKTVQTMTTLAAMVEAGLIETAQLSSRQLLQSVVSLFFSPYAVYSRV